MLSFILVLNLSRIALSYLPLPSRTHAQTPREQDARFPRYLFALKGGRARVANNYHIFTNIYIYLKL
jgi:hypothetical protein